ncbi:MAG: hypothetical protein H0V39_00190 [Nitrosomonas sp.]|nr:hypothetical protein [Nitrosomonas sp.]
MNGKLQSSHSPLASLRDFGGRGFVDTVDFLTGGIGLTGNLIYIIDELGISVGRLLSKEELGGQ